MFHVYILYSHSLQKFYVGSCSDFERRFHEHNTAQSRFTKAGVPWILVIKFLTPTRIDALALEKKIKRRGAQRFLEDNNYPFALSR